MEASGLHPPSFSPRLGRCFYGFPSPRRMSEHLETMQKKAEASREGRRLTTSPSEDTESWHGKISQSAAALNWKSRKWGSEKMGDPYGRSQKRQSRQMQTAWDCSQTFTLLHGLPCGVVTHCIQSDFSVFTLCTGCAKESQLLCIVKSNWCPNCRWKPFCETYDCGWLC